MAEQATYTPDLEERTAEAPSLLTQREQRERDNTVEEYRRRHLYGSSPDEKTEQAKDEIQDFQRDIRQVGVNGGRLNNLWLRVQYTFGRNPADVIKAQQRGLENLERKERRRILQMERERDQFVDDYLQVERNLDESLEYRGMLKDAISNIGVELQEIQQQRANRPTGSSTLEDQMTVAELRERYYTAQRKERELRTDKSRLDTVIKRYNAQAEAKRANIEKQEFLISSAYANLAEKVEEPLVQTVDSMDISKHVIGQVSASKIAEKHGTDYTAAVGTYQVATDRLLERSKDLVKPSGNGKRTSKPGTVNIGGMMKEMKELQEANAAEIDELEERRRTEPFPV